MNKIVLTSLIIFLGLVIFVVGGGVGIVFQTQKDALELEKSKLITSKLVTGVAVLGKVTKISERNVTLSSENESIIVNIEDSANMLSLFNQGQDINSVEKATSMAIKFQDIKIGDYLNVNGLINQDGIIKATTVIIPPASSIPNDAKQ
jgi:hypothetical protein